MSCLNRKIFVGELLEDVSQTSEPVALRKLPFHSEAFYFDELNSKLIVFPIFGSIGVVIAAYGLVGGGAFSLA